MRDLRRETLIDPYLSVASVAQALDVSVRTVYRLIASRRLQPDGFVNGRMRFRWSQVVRFVEGEAC